MLQIGLNICNNEEYHADREFLSSSVLKTIYKSLDDYHDQYILGNRKAFSNQNALDEGSLAHSYILEPHLVHEEFAFYPDFTKKGAAFDAFCAAHPGKKIISEPQKHRVEQLITAFKKHPIAPKLIKDGEPEQTICGVLDGIKIKVRFDYISVERGAIYDVKTTSYPGDQESFSHTLKQLSYELSASLYCQMAEQFYGKPFDFYFIVLSKKDNSCNVFKCGVNSMSRGARMISEAIKKFKKAKETGIWYERPVLPNIDTELILEV